MQAQQGTKTLSLHKLLSVAGADLCKVEWQPAAG